MISHLTIMAVPVQMILVTEVTLVMRFVGDSIFQTLELIGYNFRTAGGYISNASRNENVKRNNRLSAKLT